MILVEPDLVQSSAEMSNILIPFSKMSGNESDSKPVEDKVSFVRSSYKLVNGFPSDTHIRIRKSYVMSYNNKSKNAEWVYEILNKDTAKSNCKEHMSFGRNELENEVYVQGHLAAAANHTWCQEAYYDTYLFSNMVPQNKSLNNGDWKTIENYCRSKAKNVCNVHVYTGPLYLKEKKNRSKEVKDLYDRADPSTMQWMGGKAVPTHFFKVIVAENEDGTVVEPECYVMPTLDKEDTDIQTEANLDKTEAVKNKYAQHIEIIEEFSGLKFVESNPKVVTMDCIKTITWTGEGEKGELCSAKIKVRISSK